MMNANDRLLNTVIWKRLPGGETLEFASLWQGTGGFCLTGRVVGLESDRPLCVDYCVHCNGLWQSQKAVITQSLGDLSRTLRLETAPGGGWLANGKPRPDLADCTDIDLGLSPSTNALPINRLRLPVGGRSQIDAAWIRFPALDVVAARQAYERAGKTRFTYHGLASGFRAWIEIDAFGLPITYEGVWQRLAHTK